MLGPVIYLWNTHQFSDQKAEELHQTKTNNTTCIWLSSTYIFLTTDREWKDLSLPSLSVCLFFSWCHPQAWWLLCPTALCASLMLLNNLHLKNQPLLSLATYWTKTALHLSPTTRQFFLSGHGPYLSLLAWRMLPDHVRVLAQARVTDMPCSPSCPRDWLHKKAIRLLRCNLPVSFNEMLTACSCILFALGSKVIPPHHEDFEWLPSTKNPKGGRAEDVPVTLHSHTGFS